MSRISDFVTAVHTTLDDATVQAVVGELNRGRNRQRRRVHWYRQGGVIETPHQAGGRIPGDEDEATGNRQPTIWQREEEVMCHIFAESEDSLETLFDNWIVALDNTAPNGAVSLGEYVWDSTAKDEFSKRIPMIEVSFTVKLPVVDEIKPLTQLTDEELTCEIDEDL